MTIQIYNNDPKYTIYPVLSSGTGKIDEWLQAWFKIPLKDHGTHPYPKDSQFRLYLNGTDGIPPGWSAQVTLPLFTQIAEQPDPQKPDQYADWWGGGRVEIYYGNVVPPLAFTKQYSKDNDPIFDQNSNTNLRNPKVQDPATGAALPKCVIKDTSGSEKPCQTLSIIKDPAGLKTNEPTQLTEYTLGAIVKAGDPWVTGRARY